MGCNGKNMTTLQIRRVMKTLKARKYKVYTQPYFLNIVGVRNNNTNPTKFDDKMYVFWKNNNNKWVGRQYSITTDPSTKYLSKGGIGTYKGKKSTAILPTGQYLDTWKVGYHRGKYKALTQSKDLCVYRDYDRNNIISFNIKDKDCGGFGINIHKAKDGGADDGQGTTKTIGSYSAGCQVFANNGCFAEFMNLIQKQVDQYGTKYFTYTLLDKQLENKFRIKRIIFTTGILVGIGIIGYGIYLKRKNK